MGCRTHLGVAGPEGTYTAEYLQWGAHPVRLVPVLRRSWRTQYAGDTAAMAAAMLASGSADDPLWHGDLHEPTDDLEWLYLVHPEHDALAVYTATMDSRWRLYSRHPLATGDDDLFRYDGDTITCTGYTAVDQVEFTADPLPGYSGCTRILCIECNSIEITDAGFAVTRTPGP